MSFMDRVRTSGAQRPQDASGKEVQALHGKILQIENQVTKYKKMVDQLGTARDTSDHRAQMNIAKNKIQSQTKKIKEQILAFKSKKAELDEKQQDRLQKLIAQFTTVLDDFHKTIKLCADREMATTPQVSGEQEMYGTTSEKDSLLRHEQQQQTIQLDNLIVHNEAIIEERDQEIGSLVKDIAELNEMFQDVAVLVHDQGRMVDDIETNIVRTADHVQTARQELVQGEKNQKKATRTKIWIVVCITIVLCVIVAAIVFTSG